MTDFFSLSFSSFSSPTARLSCLMTPLFSSSFCSSCSLLDPILLLQSLYLLLQSPQFLTFLCTDPIGNCRSHNVGLFSWIRSCRSHDVGLFHWIRRWSWSWSCFPFRGLGFSVLDRVLNLWLSILIVVGDLVRAVIVSRDRWLLMVGYFAGERGTQGWQVARLYLRLDLIIALCKWLVSTLEVLHYAEQLWPLLVVHFSTLCKGIGVFLHHLQHGFGFLIELYMKSVKY